MILPPRARILNVDDGEAQRYARTRTLERAGFAVIEAGTGTEALQFVEREHPDLVLLDVNLPDMGGFEVCRRLKSDPATKPIPILHISASDVRAKDRAAGLEVGADGYMVEPVDPDELVATIRALLRISTAERMSDALNRIHALIASTLDYDEILRRAVVEGARAIGVESALISVLVDDGKAWTVLFAYGLEGAVGGQVAADTASPAMTAIRSGTPVLVEDALNDHRVNRGFVERHGLRSILLVPLQVRGEVSGCLAFHYRSAPYAFSEAQIDFAKKLAASLSLALANARLYAEAEEGRRTLDALMENIPEGITIADAPDVRIRRMSRFVQELTGLPAAIGITADERTRKLGVLRADGVTPATAESLPLVRACRGEVVQNEELVFLRPDGTRVTISCSAGPIRDASGAITGGIVAWRDISARKQLESELIEKRRMEALGLLAGGLAHEFNNMLTVIAGNSEMLLDDSAVRRRYGAELKAMSNAADRLAHFVSQVMTAAGRQLSEPQPLDLNGMIWAIERPLRHLIGSDIGFDVSLDPKLGRVMADASQVENLILNLAMNARDAMPNGGTLRVETADVIFCAEEVNGIHVLPGRYVMLAFEDTGSGMDQETRRRVFEPFFTTKKLRPGAGLGLSTVYGTVKQSGGDIRVISEPGKGARFEIYLPRIE